MVYKYKAGAGRRYSYVHRRSVVALRPGRADFSAIFTNFVVPILKSVKYEL